MKGIRGVDPISLSGEDACSRGTNLCEDPKSTEHAWHVQAGVEWVRGGHGHEWYRKRGWGGVRVLRDSGRRLHGLLQYLSQWAPFFHPCTPLHILNRVSFKNLPTIMSASAQNPPMALRLRVEAKVLKAGHRAWHDLPFRHLLLFNLLSPCHSSNLVKLSPSFTLFYLHCSSIDVS